MKEVMFLWEKESNGFKNRLINHNDMLIIGLIELNKFSIEIKSNLKAHKHVQNFISL